MYIYIYIYIYNILFRLLVCLNINVLFGTITSSDISQCSFCAVQANVIPLIAPLHLLRLFVLGRACLKIGLVNCIWLVRNFSY
jgi:hypothetical protein